MKKAPPACQNETGSIWKIDLKNVNSKLHIVRKNGVCDFEKSMNFFENEIHDSSGKNVHFWGAL